jgi:hypothetical protein
METWTLLGEEWDICDKVGLYLRVVQDETQVNA